MILVAVAASPSAAAADETGPVDTHLLESVLMVDPGESGAACGTLAQRQRQAATALLTLVAYQFVAMGDLPRVSYLTMMDRVIVWTFVMIGATLVNNVMSARRYRKNPDLGLAWDRTGRWVYPLVFAVGLGGILLRHYLL